MNLLDTSWKKNGIVFGILALFSYIILAAINSPLIPGVGTGFLEHTAILYHAQTALSEHQWPLRTITNDYGFGIGFFQFYGPLTSTLGGLILKFLNHLSPWQVVKFLTWLSSFLGGIYFYRLIVWLLQSRKIAILAAIVYQSTPYFLINMTVRGDLTECFGQGLLPMVLFYTLQLFFETPNWRRFLLTSLAWFGLLTASLMVYFYSSLFISLILLFYVAIDRSKFKKLYWLAGAYLVGLLLASWYIFPNILFHNLLLVDRILPNPYDYHFFTHLNSLLSLVPVNYSVDSHGVDVPILPALGWPVIFGTIVCIYALWTDKISSDLIIRNLNKILLLFLILATFLTWSPFNFWLHLPHIMRLEKFPYRMLTQTMWIGTLCFAFAIRWLTKDKLDEIKLVLFIFIICLSTHTWLPAFKTFKPDLNFSQIVKTPNGGIDSYANYSIYGDQKILNTLEVLTPQKKIDCQQINTETICQLMVEKEGYYRLPIFYYPKMINLNINNLKSDYIPISFLEKNSKIPLTYIGVYLRSGNYTIKSEFTGLAWANWLSILAWSMVLIGFTCGLLRKNDYKFKAFTSWVR